MIKVTQTKNQVVIRLDDVEAGWLTKALFDDARSGFCRELLEKLMQLKLPKYDALYFGVRREIKQSYKKE